MHLRRNEEHLVTLGSLGSVGYAWEATVEQGADIVEVVKKETEGPTIAPGEAPETSSAKQRFAIRALQPGRARVLFVMRRPWLKAGGRALQQRVIDVEVEEQK